MRIISYLMNKLDAPLRKLQQFACCKRFHVVGAFKSKINPNRTVCQYGVPTFGQRTVLVTRFGCADQVTDLKKFVMLRALPFWPRCRHMESDYLCVWEIAICVVIVPLL